MYLNKWKRENFQKKNFCIYILQHNNSHHTLHIMLCRFLCVWLKSCSHAPSPQSKIVWNSTMKKNLALFCSSSAKMECVCVFIVSSLFLFSFFIYDCRMAWKIEQWIINSFWLFHMTKWNHCFRCVYVLNSLFGGFQLVSHVRRYVWCVRRIQNTVRSYIHFLR